MSALLTLPLRPPVGFAHRGGRHAGLAENSLAAFRAARTAGARGIESDVCQGHDGGVALAHVIPGRRVRATTPLEAVYAEHGAGIDIALDMSVPGLAEQIVALADAAGARHRLWLTYWRLATLARWRERWPDVHLVYAGPVIPGRVPARVLRRTADAGVDVLNVHRIAVRTALVEAAHAAGIGVFAWGASPRSLPRLISAGVDGVFADDVTALVRWTGAAQT